MMHFAYDQLILDFLEEQKRKRVSPEYLLGQEKYRPLAGHFSAVSHEHYKCDCWYRYLECVREWNKTKIILDHT